MRVSLLSRQANRFGNTSEHAEKLRAVEPTTLLRCEQKIGAVGSSHLQPSLERRDAQGSTTCRLRIS